MPYAKSVCIAVSLGAATYTPAGMRAALTGGTLFVVSFQATTLCTGGGFNGTWGSRRCCLWQIVNTTCPSLLSVCKPSRFCRNDGPVFILTAFAAVFGAVTWSKCENISTSLRQRDCYHNSPMNVSIAQIRGRQCNYMNRTAPSSTRAFWITYALVRAARVVGKVDACW